MSKTRCRCASKLFGTQVLCFCLLLQGSIAQALPLPPKKPFVSEDEFATALGEASEADKPEFLKRFVDEASARAEATLLRK
jgi:hypothetical protein